MSIILICFKMRWWFLKLCRIGTCDARAFMGFHRLLYSFGYDKSLPPTFVNDQAKCTFAKNLATFQYFKQTTRLNISSAIAFISQSAISLLGLLEHILCPVNICLSGLEQLTLLRMPMKWHRFIQKRLIMRLSDTIWLDYSKICTSLRKPILSSLQ